MGQKVGTEARQPMPHPTHRFKGLEDTVEPPYGNVNQTGDFQYYVEVITLRRAPVHQNPRIQTEKTHYNTEVTQG